MKEQKIIMLADKIKNEEEVFLQFLKSKSPLFHNSNYFFRDLEYGIGSYLKKKNINPTQAEILKITDKVASFLEEKNYFKRINTGVWTVNMPKFVTAAPGDPF